MLVIFKGKRMGVWGVEWGEVKAKTYSYATYAGGLGANSFLIAAWASVHVVAP
jgi:hypothetical protein